MSKSSISGVDSRVSPSLVTRPTVLVTGGSRGIGQAICLEFGHAGWRVGVHYRERKDDAARTAATVTAQGGEGVLYQADIGDARQVETMVQEFVSRWGRLDVLVCNAAQATSGLVIRLRPDEWKAVIETNLTGTFHCLKAAANHMLDQGDGSVIVVSSFAGMQGGAGQSAYAASKAGLLGLVKTAAREWGCSNVRVNAVFPGWHERVARAFLLLTAVMGAWWWGWWVWGLLVLGLSRGRLGHPPVLNSNRPLPPSRRRLAWGALLLFLVTFTPVPFPL